MTRAGSTVEKLAALAPAFAADGTVTAGNSCPTSDGASALLVASTEAVAALGLEPLGRYVAYAVAGVDPAVMGIGPVAAVPRALARANLTLDDMHRIELNEADVAKAFLGQKCRVNPEAYPDKAYEGYVVEMAPEANRQKGTLQLKVQIKNPDRFLTPELSARVDFLTGDKASAQAPGK